MVETYDIIGFFNGKTFKLNKTFQQRSTVIPLSY